MTNSRTKSLVTTIYYYMRFKSICKTSNELGIVEDIKTEALSKELVSFLKIKFTLLRHSKIKINMEKK